MGNQGIGGGISHVVVSWLFFPPFLNVSFYGNSASVVMKLMCNYVSSDHTLEALIYRSYLQIDILKEKVVFPALQYAKHHSVQNSYFVSFFV
jgi:hypothetical protein